MSEAKIITTEGDTYLSDVYIDSESWLHSVVDREIEPNNDSDEFIFASDEAKVASLLAKTNGEPYVRVGSGADNTYNHENNFAEQILFSLWVPQSMIDDHWSSNGGVDSADWLTCDGLVVACNLHRGGDVRGNYGDIRLFEVDSIGDSAFFDWCVGWRVEDGGGNCLDPQGKYQIGYASSPLHEVEMDFGERGEWREGKFYFDAHPGVVATPYTLSH